MSMFKHRTGKKGMSRGELEQMSTASLEKLLRDDYDSRGRGEADGDELYMAAQILEERGPAQGNSADRAWELFERHYLPFAAMIAEDGDTPSSDDASRRRHSRLYQWPRRAALTAALLCTLVLSVSVAAASGIDFLKRLAQWTDEQMWLAPGQVAPAGRDDIRIPEEPKEYASLEEIFEDCGFARPVMPRWMPEGFCLENVYFDDLGQRELLCQAHYTRDEDNLVILVVIYLDDGDRSDRSYTNFQKDAGDPVPRKAGGITHLLSTNAGRPIAVWANGPAECALIGDITMAELEQMIDSIYE